MDLTSTDGLERIVVRRSRSRALITALLAGGFTATAVWFALAAETGLERLFAVSMAVFLGFGTVLALLAALDRTPVIEVDEQGIVDRGSPARAGRLSWDQVKRVEMKRVGRQTIVAIQVYRPQRFLVELPPERREAAEAAIQRHGTPFVIVWSGLDRPAEDVVDRAESLRRAYQARQ